MDKFFHKTPDSTIVIAACPGFRYLDDNNITGEIPQEIGNLSNLTILKLVKNQFNGTIPGSLGHLSELQIM